MSELVAKLRAIPKVTAGVQDRDGYAIEDHIDETIWQAADHIEALESRLAAAEASLAEYDARWKLRNEYIDGLQDKLAAAEKDAELLREACKYAREQFGEVSKRISNAEYRTEELNIPNAWADFADVMRDGTMASIRDELDAALAGLPPTGLPRNSGGES